MNRSPENINVMVVDDDFVDYATIKRGFKKANIDAPFTWAKDGIEALEMLADTEGGTPHILLIDLNMPRMGGLELIENLRGNVRFKDSKIVVLTTSKREEDMDAAMDLGVDGYVVKEDLMTDFDQLITLLDGAFTVTGPKKKPVIN